MDTQAAFLAAVWSGLSGPASLYGHLPVFRPAVADLTPTASFSLVGGILNRAFSECLNDRAATSRDAGEQLSFDFIDA